MPFSLARALLLAASDPAAPESVWHKAIPPLTLVAIWLFITAVFARLWGHRALLRHYPPVSEPLSESFGWATGSLQGVSFAGTLSVGLGERGLHLAPNGLMRSPFARGIPCVPWSDVRFVREEKGFHFEIPSRAFSFTVLGDAGRALARRLGSP